MELARTGGGMSSVNPDSGESRVTPGPTPMPHTPAPIGGQAPQDKPESRMQRYLDLDPKLAGASVGALLAVVLGDVAERLGTTLDPLVATAYAGLIIIVVTWLVPKRGR